MTRALLAVAPLLGAGALALLWAWAAGRLRDCLASFTRADEPPHDEWAGEFARMVERSGGGE